MRSMAWTDYIEFYTLMKVYKVKRISVYHLDKNLRTVISIGEETIDL